MKIGTRIIIVFVMIIVLIGVLGVVSYNTLSGLNSDVDDLVNDKMPKTVWTNNIIDALNKAQVASRDLLLYNNSETRKIVEQSYKEAADAVNESFGKLSTTVKSEQGIELLQRLDNVRNNEYYTARKDFKEAFESGNIELAKEILNTDLKEAQIKYFNIINELIDYQNMLSSDVGDEALNHYEKSIIVIFGLLAAIIVIAIIFSILLTLSITRPMKKAVEAAESLSLGKFNVDLDTNKKDETAQLLNSMKIMKNNIMNTIGEINHLSDAAMQGQLDKRGDISQYKGEYMNLVSGVNGLLDAVIGPLNITAEYVDRISKGDMPPKITDDYKGDFNEIKNNINLAIDSINLMLSDVDVLRENFVKGILRYRSDESKHNGDFRKLIAGFNNSLDRVIQIMDNIEAPIMGIDNDFNIVFMNEAGSALDNKTGKQLEGNKCFKHFKTSHCETKNCACFRAQNEDATVSAETDAHPGSYDLDIKYTGFPIKDDNGKILGAFEIVLNQTDVKNSIRKAEKVNAYQSNEAEKLTTALNKLAIGDFGVDIATEQADADTNNVKEVFDAIYSALNKTIESQKYAAKLAVSISEGDLTSEVNIRSDNDELMIALSKMKDAISSVAKDTIDLATLAAGGQIETRAEADKYKGEYFEIINGVNQTLQAVTNILNTSSNLMIADTDGIIRFMNKPVIDLLTKYESNIRQQYSDFAVSKLVGRNIDSFHKNPQHNRSLLKGLSDASHTAVIQIGDQIFKLVVTAYHDSTGGKLGYVVLWNNVTNDKLFEEELANLIETVTEGDLSASINLDKLEGNLQEISSKINQMLGLILNPINETIDVLEQMSEGNFSVQVTGNYKGDHAKLKNAINTTIEMLPINETIRILEAMADGDLTKEMKGKYKGDALKLKNSLNSTIESINEILAQVKATVEEVNRGAMQVADASNSLSQGATEQAASLEEITSSMGEIGSQTKTNAENANQANILTNQAKQSAESGNNEMGQLNNAMSEISESSANINKIIKVIDEIAFQTNLLALNAAVEAARAGRHGKGFAVVAEEVRNLAGRSASAAKETAELIENTIKRVENGSMIAGKTAEALEEIKNGNIKAADIVAEIATASTEQAQGISQINEGLNQIDKVTQTNTASAEESASASEELSGQARLLREMVMKFNLRKDLELDLDNDALMSNSRSGRALSDGRKEQETVSYDNSSNDTEDDPNDFINLDEDDFGKY